MQKEMERREESYRLEVGQLRMALRGYEERVGEGGARGMGGRVVGLEREVEELKGEKEGLEERVEELEE